MAAFIMFKFGTDMNDAVKTMLFVGIFGAFTTMSTFSIETVTLFADQQYTYAFFNFILNTVICVAGAFAGRGLSLL